MSERKPFYISCSDASVLMDSLSVRKCYIETGTIHMTAKDAQNQGKPFRALERSQMELLIHIDDLMKELAEFL